MSAELCNNVSRFDGVKYGHRASDCDTIDDLYTNSRTEAFGDVLKTAILYGSEMLSEENYEKMYDKSLRVRRVIVEEFVRLLDSTTRCFCPRAASPPMRPPTWLPISTCASRRTPPPLPRPSRAFPLSSRAACSSSARRFPEGALLTFAEKLQTASEEVR